MKSPGYFRKNDDHVVIDLETVAFHVGLIGLMANEDSALILAGRENGAACRVYCELRPTDLITLCVSLNILAVTTSFLVGLVGENEVVVCGHRDMIDQITRVLRTISKYDLASIAPAPPPSPRHSPTIGERIAAAWRAFMTPSDR